MLDEPSHLEGIGVALVSVPRFERALERFGERLLERVFTPAEVAYEDFDGGRLIRGTVVTESGDQLTGDIRWDDDETHIEAQENNDELLLTTK